MTCPASGGKTPVIMLKIVVLPAPLGPISAVVSPLGSEKDRSWTARTPPNTFSRPRSSRMASGRVPDSPPLGVGSAATRVAPPFSPGEVSVAGARRQGRVGRRARRDGLGLRAPPQPAHQRLAGALGHDALRPHE